MSQKIYHWFFNHCRPKGHGKLLNLGKKPRVLQGYQAYQQVARSTLKPQLDKEYDEYCRTLPEGAKLMEGFVWRNQRAGQLFRDETEEMKAKVDEYRRSHCFQNDSGDEGDEDTDDDNPKAKEGKKKSKEKKLIK